MPGGTGFLVECYWPGVGEGTASKVSRRLKATTGEGRRVRYLGALLVPEEETLFCFFDGTEEEVRSLTEVAGLPSDRFVRCRWIDWPGE